MSFKISKQTKRKWRNRFIVVGGITLAAVIYFIYINSFTIYDFSHLTVRQNFGPARPFEPMPGESVPGMVRAAETEYLALYVDERTTNIAVYDKRNGHIWYSSPPGTDRDPIANPFERNTMRSHVGFRFFDENRRRQRRFLYDDSISNEQFTKFSIPNGVRFEYEIGNMDIGIDAIPFFLEAEFFQEYIMGPAMERASDGDTAARNMLRQFWHPSADLEGFMRMTDAVRDAPIHTNNMLNYFYSIGWTLEDTIAANELAGVEVELNFDIFYLSLEFVLEGDRLIVNLPLSEFTTESPAQLHDMDFMKFFGAGGTDAEGFMLVPSGAGGIISFNNGGHREDPFRNSVYGMDFIITYIRPQVTQPVRLPVFGIQNNGAAMIAHIYNGSALAMVNADAAGRTNSYNHAWFSFTLRTSQTVNIDGIPGATGDLNIVQEEAYTGDITVIYQFIAGDNPGVGEMAQAYQQFLVEQGVLTPLSGPGDRSFYLDVIGAIGIRDHFLGTPFTTIEVMSTLEDADRFVTYLNNEGISNIQMQLHGWFNRGTNHDVAKNINIMNRVGRQRDIVNLHQRLQDAGGGLNPVVNFQVTNWSTLSGARNINTAFEVAKDHVGTMSGMTGGDRELLTLRASRHWTDWYFLIHPGVLPFHIDDFLPQWERRVDIDSLALSDLGHMVNESFYRRDPVNRENSRQITQEQIGRLHRHIPNLLIFGGNDYSLRYASHLVDVPTEADMFYIIDYEVPFFPMVVHGFVEFAGVAANLREHYSTINVLLNSMTTGASPRYTFTALPTRTAQFTPHERLYSTHYVNWIGPAVEHYRIFNEVYRDLRAERIVDFEILAGGAVDLTAANQVTATVFSNGTRIYVNNTTRPFEADGFVIPPQWFVVRGGTGS
jgi:hypothetical protein